MARRPVTTQNEPTVISIPEDDEIEVQEPQGDESADAPVTANDLAKSQMQLANAITAMADSQPIRKVPFSKMKIRSPFNPTGARNRADRLTRRYYQNGGRVVASRLHDEEIRLLELLKPGLFINGMVRVSIVQNGSEIDVHISYKNKGIDQQLANKEQWRSFTELLQRCVGEGKDAPVLVTR